MLATPKQLRPGVPSTRSMEVPFMARSAAENLIDCLEALV